MSDGENAAAEEVQDADAARQDKLIQRFEGMYRLLDSPVEEEAVQALRMARKLMPKIDITFNQILDMVNNGADADNEQLMALVEEYKAANEQLSAAEEVMLGENNRLNLLLRAFGNAKLGGNVPDMSQAARTVTALSDKFESIEKTAAEMTLPANAEELEEIYRARVAEGLQTEEHAHNLMQRMVMKMFRIKSNNELKQLVNKHQDTLKEQSKLITDELEFVKNHGQELSGKLDTLLSGATPKATYAEALEGLRDLQLEQGKWREALEENEGLRQENETQQAAMQDLESEVENQKRENLRVSLAYGGGDDKADGQGALQPDIEKILEVEGKNVLLYKELNSAKDALGTVRQQLARLQMEPPTDTITPLKQELENYLPELQGSLLMLERAAEATAREPVKRGLFARRRRKKAQKKIQERVDKVQQATASLTAILDRVDRATAACKEFDVQGAVAAVENARDEALSQMAVVEERNNESRESFLEGQEALRLQWAEKYEREKGERDRKEEAEKKEREREAAARRNAVALPDGTGRYEIGEEVPGQGIFITTCEIGDEEGESLSKVFNIFAAPTDLMYGNGVKTCLTYEKTVEAVSELRDWHDHDGANFKDEGEVFEALQNGSYKGEWFIPTIDMLGSKDKTAHPDSIYAHREKDTLSGTFCKTNGGSGYQSCYWTSTRGKEVGNFMYTSFGRGDKGSAEASKRLSCRLVRLVPAPPL